MGKAVSKLWWVCGPEVEYLHASLSETSPHWAAMPGVLGTPPQSLHHATCNRQARQGSRAGSAEGWIGASSNCQDVTNVLYIQLATV